MPRVPVSELPRLGAPLLFAAAILVSFGLRTAPPSVAPVVLAPGEPPAPSAAAVREYFASALARGAPGVDLGPTNAPVTVLEFSDFGCPYSGRFATQTYPSLAREFVRTGKVRWKYVPFAMGMFTNGAAAARAGTCAAEQGTAAFSAMHDALFGSQRAWEAAADPAALFRSYATAAGLDGRRFAACFAADSTGGRIRAANELADHLGVAATPTFFVNGTRVEGALPLAEFRAVLQDALHRAAAQPEIRGGSEL